MACTQLIEVSVSKVEDILARVRAGHPLADGDLETLQSLLESYAYLTELLAKKSTTISSLRHLLFGAKTERLPDPPEPPPSTPAQGDSSGTEEEPPEPPADEPKPPGGRRGHGRNGRKDYQNAATKGIPHESLQHKSMCPDCASGKVYRLREPGTLTRFTGQAPIAITVYELERLRCNRCGEVYTAKSPAGVGDEKYDPESASMLGMLRYGSGLPFNRLEKLQSNLGLPLPSQTQWEIVARASEDLMPVYDESIHQAAQGTLFHSDDTPNKILEIEKLRAQAPKGSPEARAVQTTGIVSKCGDHTFVLFMTGQRHAGERLEELLARRAQELPPPIRMCDALAANLPDKLNAIVANCLAHSRRKFFAVHDSFPAECRFVIDTLREVYKHDAEAQQLSDEERLRFHQTHSAPLFKKLEDWLKTQLNEKKVEPNSGLGNAIAYMQNHWSKLTLFLRQAGAPLDNNICERALKKAIIHRKNSLFYKTPNGANVGDIFMSLIHTCEAAKENPFAYLTALQRNAGAVARNPSHWLPWNFRTALARAGPI